MERAREHTRERPKAIENRNIKTGKGGPKRKEKEARAYKSSRGVVGGMVVFKYLASEGGHARKGAHRGPYHTHTHTCRRSELAAEKGNSSKRAAGVE